MLPKNSPVACPEPAAHKKGPWKHASRLFSVLASKWKEQAADRDQNQSIPRENSEEEKRTKYPTLQKSEALELKLS